MPKGLVTPKKSGTADGGEIIEKFIAAEGGSILNETSLCAAKGNTPSVEKKFDAAKAIKTWKIFFFSFGFSLISQ